MRGRHSLRAISHFLGFEHHVFLASLTGHLKHGPDRRRNHRPAGLIFPRLAGMRRAGNFIPEFHPRSAASAGSADVVAVVARMATARSRSWWSVSTARAV